MLNAWILELKHLKRCFGSIELQNHVNFTALPPRAPTPPPQHTEFSMPCGTKMSMGRRLAPLASGLDFAA